MSTKIYQGFLLYEDSLALIHGIVNEFRPWVMKQAQKQLDEFVARLVAGGETEQMAWRLWMDRRAAMRKSGHRDPAVDTDFSLSFIPEKDCLGLDLGGDSCVGICYTEHAKWYERWLKQPRVARFSYWDNADKPKGVSKAEWSARGAAWDTAMDGHRPVTLQSYSIDLVDDLLTPTRKGK